MDGKIITCLITRDLHACAPWKPSVDNQWLVGRVYPLDKTKETACIIYMLNQTLSTVKRNSIHFWLHAWRSTFTRLLLSSSTLEGIQTHNTVTVQSHRLTSVLEDDTGVDFHSALIPLPQKYPCSFSKSHDRIKKSPVPSHSVLFIIIIIIVMIIITPIRNAFLSTKTHLLLLWIPSWPFPF